MVKCISLFLLTNFSTSAMDILSIWRIHFRFKARKVLSHRIIENELPFLRTE